MESYSGEDVLSFLNKNQEEVHRYLSSERLPNNNNYKGESSQQGLGNNFPLLGRNFNSQQSSLNKFLLTNKLNTNELINSSNIPNNNQSNQNSIQNNPISPKNKLSSFAPNQINIPNNNSTVNPANNLNTISMGNDSLAAVMKNNSSTFGNNKPQ